ncbi:MmgE/PrpD family protein [Neorhizobium alkalisoli]|uniref:2-methylcitrate dehydratase PrpD n=1 Tax=Neorhizobium alkalisoli TaxID=528178 RepID=A0A561QAT2_9HYPH|nr:MmgE/PrpD family protein [Neorhizobium alkalisoli]TWF47475.1 2-methylcitrate dehydratase PrpD [Neorhizobium alkalisoli]
MSSLSRQLAQFSRDLRYEDIPGDIVAAARNAILDTIGVMVFGSSLPWSRIVIEYATLYGGIGASTIIGTEFKVSTPLAALANGTLAHAFEMDNLRQPSAGVHHGSTIVPALLAMAEERRSSGKDLITAFVAASEVMSRIGLAADNSAEKIGFHSPGLTGPFGSALAAGRLLGLNIDQLTNAFGISGSLCSGLLAFSKAGNGGMVKRLHTGRASEGGVLAARLAAGGFQGPEVVLEGKFGFFDAFTRDPKMEALLAGLGTVWETARICTKRYPCHITAQTPVRALDELKTVHGFGGDDIAEIDVASSEKVLSHHNITKANDITTVQYSLPFCLGIAAYRDPNDPNSFLDSPHKDAGIVQLAQRVKVSLNEESLKPGSAWATQLRVVLKDGREFSNERRDFRGAPSDPMSDAEYDEKFLTMTATLGDRAKNLLGLLRQVENIADMQALEFAARA